MKDFIIILKEIKKHCKNQGFWCDGCIFANDKNQRCILQTNPEEWDIEKIKENMESIN